MANRSADAYEQIDLTGLIAPGGMSVAEAGALAANIYFAPGFQLLGAYWRIDQIEGRRHFRHAEPEIHAACKAFYRSAF